MRIPSCLMLAIVLGLSGCLATEAQVKKGNFWQVELVESSGLAVSTGDMILIQPRSFALVPANLKKTFEISYDHSRLRLIAEEPPEGEGRMGRRYYFLALAKGSSTVEIQVKDQGQIWQSVRLNLTCGK